MLYGHNSISIFYNVLSNYYNYRRSIPLDADSVAVIATVALIISFPVIIVTGILVFKQRKKFKRIYHENFLYLLWTVCGKAIIVFVISLPLVIINGPPMYKTQIEKYNVETMASKTDSICKEMENTISKMDPYNEETIKEFVVSYFEDCGYSNVSVKVLFYQAKSNYDFHCEVRVIYTYNGKTLNNSFSQDLPKSSYLHDIP